MYEIFLTVAQFESDLNIITVAFRLLLAVLFGGLIGIERGKHGSQAGMRTHILVCLGGALTSLLGSYCVDILGYDTDPLRISAQVVSGIGFLGAGMIIVKSEKMITGLTTAAIMWTTAIIGIAAGIGFYSGALVAMLACVFTAAVLTRLEGKRKKSSAMYLEINDLSALSNITAGLKSLLPADSHLEITPAKSGIEGHLGIQIISAPLKDSEVFKTGAAALEGVHFVIVE